MPEEHNSRQPDPATNSRQPQATTHSTSQREGNNTASRQPGPAKNERGHTTGAQNTTKKSTTHHRRRQGAAQRHTDHRANDNGQQGTKARGHTATQSHRTQDTAQGSHNKLKHTAGRRATRPGRTTRAKARQWKTTTDNQIEQRTPRNHRQQHTAPASANEVTGQHQKDTTQTAAPARSTRTTHTAAHGEGRRNPARRTRGQEHRERPEPGKSGWEETKTSKKGKKTKNK